MYTLGPLLFSVDGFSSFEKKMRRALSSISQRICEPQTILLLFITVDARNGDQCCALSAR